MSIQLSKMLEDATKAATDYAAAYNANAGKARLKALKKAATNAFDEYNLCLSRETYRAWAKEGDAVRTAIRLRFVPNAKKVAFKTNDDDYMTVVIGDNTKYPVNLPQMQATLGTDAFNDPHWFSKCEKLMYAAANIINEHLGNGSVFNMNISDAGREFNFTSEIDSLDDECVVTALQTIFDSILFIEDPDNEGANLIKTRIEHDKYGNPYSVDWQYIRESMTMNTGCCDIKMCNTGKFTAFVADVMHKIITTGTFKFDIDGEFTMPEAVDAEEESSEE